MFGLKNNTETYPNLMNTADIENRTNDDIGTYNIK